MSIVGIDFGNTSLLISQAAKGGVDVILNDASMRQTATSMSFQGKQRFFGDAAAAMARSNVKNTISCMKLLVGRRYDEPAVQAELAKAPFRHTRTVDGGVGVIVTYNEEDKVIPAEHLMAMMLSLGKTIAFNANNKVNIADSVLAVPCWFTDAQRRGIMNACSIVGLNCLKVVKETTAIALSYGIYKSAKGLFSETEPVHVMFIDIGYTCYSVVIADFVQEKLVIRSTAWDQLGGRDFDDVIIEFLAEQFQKKTSINVRNNVKAMLKLQAAAEKAKKTLSPVGVTEANISVECLAEDRDVNCNLSLEEFERRSAALIARLEAPILSALAEAGLSREQLSDVEIVGGSSRVQCIKRTIGAALGLDATLVNCGLKTTMNSDEAVARGSALQCAMLSSRVKVKPFNIIDRVEYPVEILFESTGGVSAADHEDAEGTAGATVTSASAGGMDAVQIFARGDELPHKPRRLTFRNKSSAFDLTARYAVSAVSTGTDGRCNALPAGTNPTIGSYRINLPEKYRSTADGTGYDVRVTFGLDRSGNLYVVSAQLMEELPAENVPPTPPEGKEGEASKEPETAKRRFQKVDLEVTVLESFGMTPRAIKECVDTEAAMTAEDTLIRETADKRNELESFIYSMRHKLDNSLKNYCTNSEKQQLVAAMDSAEEWLYGDGFESTKQQYTKKIDALRGPANLIEFRLNEETSRPVAAEGLKQQVAMVRAYAANTDKDHEHITTEERDTIRAEADRAEAWLYDMLSRQADLAQYQDPVLTAESIGQKRQALLTATRPVMTKPKPAPAPVPAAAANKEEGKTDAKDESAQDKEDGKMDTDDASGNDAEPAVDDGAKMDTSDA